MMDDTLAVRDLAERLLASQHPAESEVEPRLLAGAVPDDLPILLPLPDGATVVGSVSYPPVRTAYDHRDRRVTIILDVGMRPEDVLTYYQDRLRAQGWQDARGAEGPDGGFRFAQRQGRVGRLFCRGEQGPALRVYASARRRALTQVHLELDTTTRHSPCREPRGPQQEWQPPLPLPTVRYPADATPVAGTWGTQGASAQSVHADAIVRTGHDLVALTSHIERQLESAGWTRDKGGVDGALAWSVWSVSDAHGFPWRGVLYIARRPDQEG